MNFPNLKTAKVLDSNELLSIKGGSMGQACKKGCLVSCKSSCSPGNSNTGSGNTVNVPK